ncbi:heavy-metal-associated domain-containing protein [Capillimicrobium parvum]|uniref:Copper chaperone CopZ n=1 Tax=Capillimicrobium parvum TaxID=2884022 RepID=A0A9E6XU57_9ACTN|nr:heavy metal-associated domain-containing protein [Capillimicrobium parvum]UGS34488.1 Copper chaperone CopZ [Capillimicrobium parvum]
MSQTLIQTSRAREYQVAGMSCTHCVSSVREEVSEIPGVGAVEIDLATGRLVVAGEGVSDDAVAAAVAEAGYEVAR